MSTGFGQQTPYDQTSPLAEISFIIRQMIARMNTMKLVSVSAVHNGGGNLATAGTVDVQPLVSQIDGNGNAQAHGLVCGIQYFRLQGGVNAIICDPAVGDVGYVICADRDSTNVKNSQSATVTPGSFRRYDLQDGVYVGGVLNAKPQQYIQFDSNNNIVLQGPNGNSITINSGGIVIQGNLTVPSGTVTLQGGNLIVETPGQLSLGNGMQISGPITGLGGGTYGGNFATTANVTAAAVSATGEVTALSGGSSVTLGTHKHSGVTTGGGTSGSPVGGT